MIPKGRAGQDFETVPPDRGSADSQPTWRRDFPIAWPQDEWVSRRELIKFMVLTSAAFSAGQVWILLKSLVREDRRTFPRMAIASVDELPVGGARTFTYPEGSSPRLLVRTGERSFVAYDQQCTHLLCPVVPDVRRGKLHCPCHNGWFDLASGRPVAGPPQRALAKISLEVTGGEVFAIGVEEGQT